MLDENEVEVPAEEVVEEAAPQEEVAPETEAPAEESVEEVKARLAKAEELANNYKVRAEKAEKKYKEVPVASQPDGLASKDVIYLAKADIHEDDVDEVLETARQKNISVSKAHEYLKPILAVRAEQRTTASAANVSNVRRGPSKTSDEALLNKAKGNSIENDSDIERMVAAQAASRRG